MKALRLREAERVTFLDGLRVLDLTDERGLLAGRLLADLGADVVQLEPPGGSTGRRQPPLLGDDHYASLFWDTYAANKRGALLNLDEASGQGLAQRLVAKADIFLTSWPPARLAEWGLSYETLGADNAKLIYVAISAFGLAGPKAGYADSDLVVWAAGGPLDPHREEGRPPLRISVPQAFLHASADAAAGALVAYMACRSTGRGQLVDVSAQASLGVATLGRVLAHPVGDAHPEWHRESTNRVDQSGSGSGGSSVLKKWQCKDGLVELHLAMGQAAGAFTNNFFAWMHSEDACDDRLAGWDWRMLPEQLEAGTFTQDDLLAARDATAAFLSTKTKAQVLEAAIERRLLCVGIYDSSDIARSPHLEARGYWAEVGSGPRKRTLPGALAQVSADALAVTRPAPLPGEHTREVLSDWLGYDDKELDRLASAEVIA